MYPLIYINKDLTESFELLKIRNSILQCLLELNINYCSSFEDETFDLIHFFSINDLEYFSKSLRKSVKKIISLLSCEEEPLTKIIKLKKDELGYVYPYIEKKNVEIINSADCVLVPSLKAKKFLLLNGVTSNIEIFINPIKTIKYDLKNNILNKAIFRYLGINEDSYLVVLSLSYDDYDSFEFLSNLVKTFPDIKFVVLFTKAKTKKFLIKTKKTLGNNYKNLYFVNLIDDDLYISLFYNAKIYLNISSSFGNDQELIDAMVSKTQVLSLNCSSFSDITIDKENCYTYNNFADLKKAVSLYYNGLLPSTIEGGIEFTKNINVRSQSLKLERIYKNILEEN